MPDTWLQLDALEFDPPRRSEMAAAGQMCSGFACSTSVIYTEMMGLVIVSCDEEDVISRSMLHQTYVDAGVQVH